MFGTVRPRSCALPGPDRQAWRHLYCGTCKGLHAYGTPARALTSYDAVLLGAMVEGLQAEAAPCGSCRCPLNPLMHRPIVAPQAVATRAGAAVQVLLADAWLADRADDGVPAAAWLRPWVPSGRASAALEELGLDPAPFVDLAARQARVEAGPDVDPTAAASPTRALLGHLLASLPDLPGTDPSMRSAEARQALGQLGADLGTAIYLIDALEDLAKDTRSGNFNPCLDADGHPHPARTDAAVLGLEGAVERLVAATRAFPWRRNTGLLEHLLTDRLPLRARGAVRQGRAALRSLPAAPVGWMSWLWAAGQTDPERDKRPRSGCADCCVGCDCTGCDCCCEIDCCPCDGCDCGCG